MIRCIYPRLAKYGRVPIIEREVRIMSCISSTLVQCTLPSSGLETGCMEMVLIKVLIATSLAKVYYHNVARHHTVY